MTYYRGVWIGCDADGCLRDYGPAGATAAETRECAKHRGWANDGADDYCPEHSHLAHNGDGP